MVADPETHDAGRRATAPRSARSCWRGNTLMKGYLKNETATEEAFAGGFYHSGDLAVWHADGYIEVKDRSKDIIISGGENISSLEVEEVLYRHPAGDGGGGRRQARSRSGARSRARSSR